MSENTPKIVGFLRDGNKPWERGAGVVGINLPEAVRACLKEQQLRLKLPSLKATVYAAIIAGLEVLERQHTNGSNS